MYVGRVAAPHGLAPTVATLRLRGCATCHSTARGVPFRSHLAGSADVQGSLQWPLS